MTMVSGRRTIAAGRFKATCLRLLDDVATKGEVVITKYGRPVARLVPIRRVPAAPLAGLIEHQDDLVSPIEEPWDAER